MASNVETRASLLLRVRNPADQAAWNEFVEIYRPLILRIARRKGMQDADAEDIAQQVLFAVAKAVEAREHDARRSKLRTWLHRVARNAILNALSRGKPDRGSGDTAVLSLLREHASPDPWQYEQKRLVKNGSQSPSPSPPDRPPAHDLQQIVGARAVAAPHRSRIFKLLGGAHS